MTLTINVLKEPVIRLLTSKATILESLHICALGARVSRGDITGVATFPEVRGLLQRLMDKKPHPHDTVLEHTPIAFLITCSRIATHQLVRHRLCSFVQKSSRYCVDRTQMTVLRPPHIDIESGAYTDADLDSDALSVDASSFLDGMCSAFSTYRDLLTSKIKNESARYVLPACLAADILITANLRQWRLMLSQRTTKHASPEMRFIFGTTYHIFRSISPVLTYNIANFEWPQTYKNKFEESTCLFDT